MGSVVQAICPCGYQDRFTIGGSRQSYLTESYFPYRCTTCGIVSANIAEEEIRCPNDADHTIIRIGGSFDDRMSRRKGPGDFKEQPPLRKLTFMQWLGIRKPPPLAVVPSSAPMPQIDPGPEPRVRCQWGDHEIYDEDYECPECGELALRFSRTLLHFD